jgi:hypothetical protein
MSHSSPDVLAVHIKIPAEAVVPLLIGVGALLVLVFAGGALASWKERNPKAASTFGLVMAVIMTGISIYFLTRCLWNQMDPNNEGTGQLQFMDPPIAGFMAACGAAFWRMGEQPKVALAIGILIGGLMLIKPWVWPVISDFYGGGTHYVHARGLLDPEHAEFVGSGIVVLVTGLIAGLKAKPIPPHPPYGAQRG